MPMIVRGDCLAMRHSHIENQTCVALKVTTNSVEKQEKLALYHYDNKIYNIDSTYVATQKSTKRV